MATPFIGEIRITGFNFAPQDWAFCDGSLLSIADNEALFNLLGTTYGGNGQTTFALPDLRGRVPVHQGNSFVIGQNAGVESIALTTQQIAGHTHTFSATSAAATSAAPPATPTGVLAVTTAPIYAAASPNTPLSSTNSAGGGQPHDNLMPSLSVNFIISLFGIFPSQN